jgi:serine protease
MLRSLKNWLSSKRTRSRQVARLNLEAFEDRLVPAVSLASIAQLPPVNVPGPTVMPSDPEFGQQWALNNTAQAINGSPGGKADADIDAPEAWYFATGSSRTVVSVLDSGIDYTHPDLYRNIWLNRSEIPQDISSKLVDADFDGRMTFYDLNASINLSKGLITDLNHTGYIDGGDLLRPRVQGGWADGVDTDGNGHVDDLIGWDFQNNDNNPMDDNGHGTAVAGVIGADGNNGLGVAGINWRVQLMPLKISNSSGNGDIDNSIHALHYAVAEGAAITNYSNGYEADYWDEQDLENGGFLPDNLRGPSYHFREAIRDARDHGHIFVASAGNDGHNNDHSHTYPANFDVANLVSVAASDFNDQLVVTSGWSSNYGLGSVDLAAPGSLIRTTNLGGGYGYWGGTSFSAPQVAGVMALVRDAHPDWSYHQVIDQVLRNVDEKAALDNVTGTGGRLNALKAIAPGAWITDSAPLTPGGPYTWGTTFAAPATITGLRVTFNEAIQVSTFTAPDVSIAFNPYIPAAAMNVYATSVLPVAGSNGRSFDILFGPITTREGDVTAIGTYTLHVGADIRNLAGQKMNQDRDSYIGESNDYYTTSFQMTYTAPGTTVTNFVNQIAGSLVVDITVPPPVVSVTTTFVVTPTRIMTPVVAPMVSPPQTAPTMRMVGSMSPTDAGYLAAVDEVMARLTTPTRQLQLRVGR